MAILGLVLAAGAGTRMGQPKALVADRHGQTWLARSVEALQEGGVETVYAVVGASANEVRAAAPAAAIWSMRSTGLKAWAPRSAPAWPHCRVSTPQLRRCC